MAASGGAGVQGPYDRARTTVSRPRRLAERRRERIGVRRVRLTSPAKFEASVAGIVGNVVLFARNASYSLGSIKWPTSEENHGGRPPRSGGGLEQALHNVSDRVKRRLE